MSFIMCKINDTDVTRDLISIGDLSEYNDESIFFSGVFRRGNLEIVLDNNTGKFSRNSDIFPLLREGSTVEFSYKANNPLLDPYFIFKGLIAEGSTENDLTKRDLKLLVVDLLKVIDDVNITKEDIEKLISNLGTGLKLNKEFISEYLDIILSKAKSNALTKGEIGLTIESLFPPSDSFFDSNNVSALGVLNELLRSVNSYSVLTGNSARSLIEIRPRSESFSRKSIKKEDVLDVFNQTDGFNKVYNSITINNSPPYEDQASIDNYGVRVLNISSHAPPSEALAQTYLEYYSEPRQEFDLSLKMKHETLDLRIGEFIKIDTTDLNNRFIVQPIISNGIIISRTINFSKDIVTLRVREG